MVFAPSFEMFPICVTLVVIRPVEGSGVRSLHLEIAFCLLQLGLGA